jgi:hypothetical protein
MIDKYGALLHQKWIEDGTSKNNIFGFWAEDGSFYIIDCPTQLRELLVKMQNQLCDLYKKWDKDNRDLKQFEYFLERIFP